MRHANTLLAVLVIVVVVPLVYAGAYLAVVRHKDAEGVSHWDDGAGGWTCAPHYRVGGALAERFFRPAFLVDRRLRPTYWSMPV